MNLLTSTAREQFLTGARDWTAGTYKVRLMPDSYTFDAGDDVVGDLPAGVAERTFTGRGATDGLATADDDVITGVAAAIDYAGMWVFDDGDGQLVAWIDTQSNGTPLAGTTTGLDISVLWSQGVFRL